MFLVLAQAADRERSPSKLPSLPPPGRPALIVRLGRASLAALKHTSCAAAHGARPPSHPHPAPSSLPGPRSGARARLPFGTIPSGARHAGWAVEPHSKTSRLKAQGTSHERPSVELLERLPFPFTSVPSSPRLPERTAGCPAAHLHSSGDSAVRPGRALSGRARLREGTAPGQEAEPCTYVTRWHEAVWRITYQALPKPRVWRGPCLSRDRDKPRVGAEGPSEPGGGNAAVI